MALQLGSSGRLSSIWWFAFGYFACYVPYSALTKAVTSGIVHTAVKVPTGIEILPPTLVASILGMYTFITAMGWWKFAGHRMIAGMNLPTPNIWTFFSGLCTATIVVTTTLAYTFTDVSIVFVMLLMRGGVLIMAPVVDRMAGRHVRWFSWIGLALSIGALFSAFESRGSLALSITCIIDILAYLFAYLIRLRLMSRFAKSTNSDANLRYFVEEQMVATPAVLVMMALLAVLLEGSVGDQLRYGFGEIWTSDAAAIALVIGLFSQGTGIFGGLVLLDGRENTYCVPVNRCSSVLAGVGAAYSLKFFLGSKGPSDGELVGAGLIVSAILFLSIPPLLEKRRSAHQASLTPATLR